VRRLPIVAGCLVSFAPRLGLAADLQTLARWANRLQRGAVTSDNFEALMLELRLGAKSKDQIVPTLDGLGTLVTVGSSNISPFRP
jgi:hypothetical protein